MLLHSGALWKQDVSLHIVSLPNNLFNGSKVLLDPKAEEMMSHPKLLCYIVVIKRD